MDVWWVGVTRSDTHGAGGDEEAGEGAEAEAHRGAATLMNDSLAMTTPWGRCWPESVRAVLCLAGYVQAGLELPPQPVKQPDLFDVVAGEIEER